MKKVAIIQARMGSTRLPGKILLKVKGITILEHIIERVRHCCLVDDIVVASTTNTLDNQVEEFCTSKSISCFRGSEEDVLERYVMAANYSNADVIIRVTADDPLKDPIIIDQAIGLLLENGLDYVSNTIKPTYPEGLDIEVFTYQALLKAHQEAFLSSDREHVTPYIWKNPNIFKLYNFTLNKDFSALRWTLDSADDYEFIGRIYDELYVPGKIFFMDDVINLLQCKPELLEINAGHVRNEGYLKSIRKEQSNNGIK